VLATTLGQVTASAPAFLGLRQRCDGRVLLTTGSTGATLLAGETQWVRIFDNVNEAEDEAVLRRTVLLGRGHRLRLAARQALVAPSPRIG